MSTSTLSTVEKELHGVIVQFPDMDSVQQAIPDPSYLYQDAQATGDSLTCLFRESEFNELAPYWNEHFSIQDWHFHYADYVENKEWRMTREVHWSEILISRPKLWIDDVIQAKMVTMVYQPIFNWKDNAFHLHSHEILARGYIGNGQVILPELLFDEARQRGRLYHLDRLCRIEALRASRLCPANSKIFINFSPSSIFSPKRCLQSTFEEAKRLSIDPGRVVFEIVESDLINDLTRIRAILDHFRDQGYSYALDDVGKGMNNIERIRQFHPDYVKLDRLYVRNIDKAPLQQECAKRVAESAEHVNATCIAEGVESVEESDFLRTIGYVIQQGYLFGRPESSPLTDIH